MPYLLVIVRIFSVWRWNRVVRVSSLDDRAMLEYGMEFEQLRDAQQKDLLKRYRVGTYLLNYFPDEREGAEEQESQMRAYAMLRWLLPIVAAVYAVGWWLLPEGSFRVGWTNGPVVVTWLFLLILALPQMIRMWTEPDEMGEPKVVEREA